MARIPVAPVRVETRHTEEHERRSGLPLWIWPLIPLVLGALALGLSLRGDDNRAAQTNAPATNQGVQAPAQPAANGEALTDMMAIVNDQNAASYAGRQASFADVRVQSVVGDRGFWVGPNANKQLFVVIDEENAGQAEGQVQIVPGQRLTLGGVIEKLPPADQIPAEWGLDANNGAALANQQVYLHAKQIAAAQ